MARWVADRFIFPTNTLRGLPLDNVVVISERVRDRLRASGVGLPDVRVLYQGIDTQTFFSKNEPGALHEPLRLLYVGQLLPYKGVHTAIEGVAVAAARSCHARLRLTIVGAGEPAYVTHLETIAREHAIDADFLGRLPHEELPAIYREHDVLIFPSIWQEPLGLTYLEAMASGTPVLSTLTGGQAELLKHGDNAWSFEPNDSASLADGILRLAGDPLLCRRLARNGRESVEKHLGFHQYVSGLEAALERASACAA